MGTRMPKQLRQSSATVNGKITYVYYVNPAQINLLTLPDPMNGSVQVVLPPDLQL